MLDDLFTYRLDADRYLTVTNAANHAQGPRLVPRATPTGFDVEVIRPHRRLRDARRAGPARAEIVQAIADAPLPARITTAERRLAGRDVLVCGTGYTGEDGVELLLAARRRRRVWDELVRRGAAPVRPGRARHAAPGGLLPPLRQRPDARSAARSRPASAGAARRTRASSAPRPSRAVRARRPGREARRRSRSTAPGSPRQGNPVVGGGEVDERHALAVPGDRHRHGLRARRARRAGHRLEIDVRGKRPRRRRRAQAAATPQTTLTARSTAWPRRSYPDDLLYHPEHDWARDRRRRPPRFGITWYAQDALGEVVFFDPPAGRHARSTQGRALRRGRVGQGRLRRDRPAVRRDRRGQRGARRHARDDQRGPLRRGLAGEGAPVRPVRAATAPAGRRAAYTGDPLPS